jgi:hypothetical protein
VPGLVAYDEIADWYETEFLAAQAGLDPLGVDRALRTLLGPGSGPCLEIGVFLHVGVHPCFCGGFADHTDRDAVVIRPGYLDRHWTRESWTEHGIRDKVGAQHFPLPELLRAFLAAGLVLDGFAEGGEPTPTMLAVRARAGSLITRGDGR